MSRRTDALSECMRILLFPPLSSPQYSSPPKLSCKPGKLLCPVHLWPCQALKVHLLKSFLRAGPLIFPSTTPLRHEQNVPVLSGIIGSPAARLGVPGLFAQERRVVTVMVPQTPSIPPNHWAPTFVRVPETPTPFGSMIPANPAATSGHGGRSDRRRRSGACGVPEL
eukprot:754608-Hanusia_phi.AAC.1